MYFLRCIIIIDWELGREIVLWIQFINENYVILVIMVKTLFKKKTIKMFYRYFFKQIRIAIEYKVNRIPILSSKKHRKHQKLYLKIGF